MKELLARKLRREFLELVVVQESFKGVILYRIGKHLARYYVGFVLKCQTKILHRIVQVVSLPVQIRQNEVEHRVRWILRDTIVHHLLRRSQLAGDSVCHGKIVDQHLSILIVKFSFLLFEIQRFLIRTNRLFIVMEDEILAALRIKSGATGGHGVGAIR